MTAPMGVRTTCLALGGDVVVGTLLSQIVFVCLRGPQITRDGVDWIAKTRAEWMAETGLTLNQYRRAILVLKTRGLIELRVMRRQGIAYSHVRLLQPIARFTGEGENHPTGWVETTQPKRLYKYPQRVTFSTAFEERNKDSDLAIANQDSPVRGSDRSTGGGEGREEREVREPESVGEPDDRKAYAERSRLQQVRRGWMMKAEDVLKAHSEVEHGSLAAFWKSRVALHTEEFQRALTAKDVAQLKQLHKYLGDQTKPVIAYAIEHWWKFASRAGAAAGCSFPADPHIGFLLKHHAVAVNLLTPVEVAPTLPTPPMEGGPVQSVAPQAETLPVHSISSQELTDLIEGLKSP